MRNTASYLVAMLALIAGAGCDMRTPEVPENPFEGNHSGDSTLLGQRDSLSLESFAGLHQHIFSATCANSGCHDGTFEPDFRTISGSYNTLVYQPVIKNDPSGSFTYRVLPGNVLESVLMNRLLTDIDGQSGIMPLAVDPESNWLEQKDQYIDAIESWIQNGAPDMFGNLPQTGNLAPTMTGAFAQIPATLTPLPREAQSGPIQVSSNVPQVEVWVALEDDNIDPGNLHKVELLVSDQLNGFDDADEVVCQVVPQRTETGLNGSPAIHMHRGLVNLTAFSAGTTVFFRVRVIEENGDPPVITPSDGSLRFIKEYFALTIVQ